MSHLTVVGSQKYEEIIDEAGFESALLIHSGTCTLYRHAFILSLQTPYRTPLTLEQVIRNTAASM